MGKIFHIIDGHDESHERYNQRDDADYMLEKAFKEGCEHGYKKAMREFESYDERGSRMGGRVNHREGFEEKIEKLKEKYK